MTKCKRYKKLELLDLEYIYKRVWCKISKNWSKAIEKFNEERVIVDFPFDNGEEIVKLAIKLTLEEVKQNLKRLADFWLKYRNRPEWLARDIKDKEISKQAKDFAEKMNNAIDEAEWLEWLDKYNVWLLKLGLKTVLEG